MGHFTDEGLKKIGERTWHPPPRSPTSAIWESVARWVLALLPHWTPSVLAMIAVLVLFSGYAVFMLYPIYHRFIDGDVYARGTDWEFKTYEYMQVPPIFYVYAAVATLGYLVLKAAVQLRALEKTQASVLVEIMAHTCDSLAITIMTLTLAAATRLGVSTETTILFCGMHLDYYTKNWEGNHRGLGEVAEKEKEKHFVLSVNEGLLFAAMAYLVNLYDAYWWRADVGVWIPDIGKGSYPECPTQNDAKHSDGCLRLNQLAVYIFAVVILVRTVVRVKAVRDHHDQFEDGVQCISKAYNQMMPIISTCLCTVLWAHSSPTELFRRRPHFFFCSIGCVLGNVNIRLMTANLSKQTFNCYPYMLLLLALSTLISISGGYGHDYDRHGPNEDICLMWFFINAVKNLQKLTTSIIRELCQAMDASLLHAKKIA